MIYMVLVVPIGFPSDETQHILRAYQVSLGTLFPQIIHCVGRPLPPACFSHYHSRLTPHRRVGGPVAVSLSVTLNHIFEWAESGRGGTHFNPHVYTRLPLALGDPRTVFAHFENTALYSPANYVPQSIVLWLGRKLAEPVITTLFAGRFATGLVWAALVTAAVAIVPRWKWLFALALLVPTAITQGSSFSADSMAFAATGFTIAVALRLADRNVTLRRREVAAVSALCLLIGLLKTPLPIVIVAVVAILWPVLGRGSARAARAAAVALPGFAAAIWWTLASSAYFVPYRNAVYQPPLQVFISPSEQAHYLLGHITAIPALLWQTLIHGQVVPISGLVGAAGETSLGRWFALGWLCVFFVLVLGSHEGASPRRPLRLWLGGTLLAYVLATVLVLYLSWTAVGASIVSGMHGRYYTPVLALLIPLLAGLGGKRLRLSERAVAWTAIVVLLACSVTMCAHVATDYYHQPPWQALSRTTGALF